MTGDLSLCIALCDECEKHNTILELACYRDSNCNICGKKTKKNFSTNVSVEEDVEEILKDFYQHEDVVKRAMINKSKILLYGKVED